MTTLFIVIGCIAGFSQAGKLSKKRGDGHGG